MAPTRPSLDGGRMTPAWMATLRDCGRQTRELFREGRPVCDGVSGRLRYELRATWLGGTRILDRLDQSVVRRLHGPPRNSPSPTQ